jgi:hypothetical protein
MYHMKSYLSFASFVLVLLAGVSFSAGTASAQATTIVEPVPTTCFSPVTNIRFGADDMNTNGVVTSLQQFLSVQGFFDTAYAGTGHFGPRTLKAVAAFQSANALPSTGYVGPLTRAVISRHCGTTPVNTAFSATPTSGTAPLLVSFSGTGLTGGSQYIVDYGDGANSGPLTAINICMGTRTNPAGCPRIGANHTYTSTGSYTAMLQGYMACMWSNPRCMIATMPLGSATITVGTSGQHPLSIQGLDAPTTLALGQQGTWTVHVLANTTSNSLHYSVVWGDEQYMTSSIMAPNTSSVNTSSTFTHAYQHSGMYTPVFTVTDDSGASVSSSATITVTPWY